MKTLIVTALATTVVALDVFAQGSLSNVQCTFQNEGITTPGANATDPINATTWYRGNLTLELLYGASGVVTADQVAALNALNGTEGGGAGALSLALADGFAVASATTGPTSLNPGFLSGAARLGYFTTATPDEIGLLGVPTRGSGYLALYVVGSGDFADYSGLLAWSQANLGGNPNGVPPGIPALIVHDPAGQNLVLVASQSLISVPVPEPGTMALAAFGGASLLLFRRRK